MIPHNRLKPSADLLSRWERLLFLSLAGAFIGCEIFRLCHGVDFTDEAYYNAVAYQFALGDQPFVDQFAVHQTAFVLVAPLIWLFHGCTGGTEGLVLFVRLTFLGFSIVVGMILYWLLRECFPKSLAFLAGLLCVALVGQFVTFSYNSQGCLFLLIGLVLQFRVAEETPSGCNYRRMLLAGLACGLAVMSYPTLILPVLLSTVVTLAFRPLFRPRLAGIFALGFCIAMIPLLALAWNAGWQHLVTFAQASSIAATHAGQAGGWRKISRILHGIWGVCFSTQLVQAGTIFLAGLGYLLRRSAFRALVGAALLLSAIGLRVHLWESPFEYLMRISIWGPLFYFLIRDGHAPARQFLWCVYVPSLAAALTTAWTSANGAMNAGIGAIPAALATLIMLGQSARDGLKAPAGFAQAASFIIPLAAPLMLLVYQMGFVYGEGKPTHLTACVQQGPYRGIWTTATKAELCSLLVRDVAKYAKGPGRVLFYDFFPAGYLFSSKRSASPTTWEMPPSRTDPTTRNGVMAYISSPQHQPDVIFEMKILFGYTGTAAELNYGPKDPLASHVRA